MGFATGFTGGVTLTLGVAYLTVLAHQRNRQRQCDLIAANTSVLRALASSDPAAAAWLTETAPSASAPVGVIPPGYELGVSPRPATSNAIIHSTAAPPSLADELKARWNAEVSGAVRRVQTTDWVGVREDAEAAVSHLWREVFGSAAETAAAAAETSTPAPKAHEALEEAKATAAAAVAAAAAATSATPVDPAAPLTDVELALQQRYTKPDDAVMKKSVGELLEERYKH